MSIVQMSPGVAQFVGHIEVKGTQGSDRNAVGFEPTLRDAAGEFDSAATSVARDPRVH